MADTIEIVQGTATTVEIAGPTGPQGPAGSNGAAGEAATVTVGTVTTGAAGSSASVTNTGTSSAAVLAFAIPRGDKGDKGDTGSTGPAGTTNYDDLTNKPNQGLDTSDNVTFNSVTASTEAAPGLFGGGDISGGRIIATVRTDGASDLPAQQIFESIGTTNKLTVTVPNSLAANRAVAYPDASGTLALTSDIPSTFAASAITSGTLGTARLGSGAASSGTWLRGDSTWQALPAAGTKTYARWDATMAQPPATNFPQLDTRNSIAVLDFDAATDESAVFVGIMPEGASLGSGLTVYLHWMATSATSGNVRWGAQLERSNTDLDSDSFDTATEANGAANGTSGIVTVTSITLTNIDGVTAGDLFRLKVYRNADDATNDTMTGDAELVAVELRSAA